jgi:serine/threonine-protein kinase RsbW
MEDQATAVPIARDRIEISSDPHDLAQARGFVRRFCGGIVDSPPDEASVGLLELAVNEAASNIMKHAYAGRTDQRIQIDIEAFADRIVIRLHHQGTSFSGEATTPPAFDASRDHGFGLYLIAHSVDDVRYDRDEVGRSQIWLVKKRRSGGK